MVELALFLALTVGHSPTQAETVSPDHAERWRDDLRYVTLELPKTHPHPFRTMSQGEFEQRMDRLIEKAPELAHQEIILELAEVVARLEDGHSRVTLPLADSTGFFLGHAKTPLPAERAMHFHPLPVRLYFYSDGLFIRMVGAENRAVAGARVLAIARKPVDEVVEAVRSMVHRDNHQQLRLLLTDYLVLPEALHAKGILDEIGPVDFEVQTVDGRTRNISFDPVADGATTEWVDARMSAEPPLYLRQPERNFWLEKIDKVNAAYWRYNECYDQEDESIKMFADRLSSFLTNEPVDKLIIDLRGNRGGSNTLNQPLLLALIRHEKLQQPGSLFAITDRATFSAAMMFAVALEQWTPVFFCWGAHRLLA
jgi:hypothetical protein